jgi:hypothetical protein
MKEMYDVTFSVEEREKFVCSNGQRLPEVFPLINSIM